MTTAEIKSKGSLPPSQVDPKRTLIVCFEYGGIENGHYRWLPVLSSVQQWVSKQFATRNVVHVNSAPLICARNRAIRDVVLPRVDDFEWLISIDNDVTITHPGVEMFMAVEADVVSCRCRVQGKHAWAAPTSFHNPFWRCRMEVFRRLAPPWFRLRYSPDMCEVTACECQYFRDKCLAARFTVAHGGRCGHKMAGSHNIPPALVGSWNAPGPQLSPPHPVTPSPPHAL